MFDEFFRNEAGFIYYYGHFYHLSTYLSILSISRMKFTYTTLLITDNTKIM
jgi:hypothetical protein